MKSKFKKIPARDFWEKGLNSVTGWPRQSAKYNSFYDPTCSLTKRLQNFFTAKHD